MMFRVSRLEEEVVRKVSSGFLMLRLLFREEACEGDYVSIDLFLRYRNTFAICLGHN